MTDDTLVRRWEDSRGRTAWQPRVGDDVLRRSCYFEGEAARWVPVRSSLGINVFHGWKWVARARAKAEVSRRARRLLLADEEASA